MWGREMAYFTDLSQAHAIFIDGGSSDRKQLGENVIMPFLKYNGHTELYHTGLFSHADSDHISGLSEVIDSGYTIEGI